MDAPTAVNEDLLYVVEGGIAHLTFNRPQARNALTFAMYKRMAEICGTTSVRERSIKALILTGTGEKAFASGTDISQFRAFKTMDGSLLVFRGDAPHRQMVSIFMFIDARCHNMVRTMLDVR